MSKASRQTAKQNRPPNKQNTDQPTKEDQSLKATNQGSKQVQPGNKQGTEQPSRQNQPAGRQLTRQAAKYERRREEQRRREEDRQRAVQRKRITLVSVVVAALLVLGFVGYFAYTNYIHPSTGHMANVTATATLVDPNYPSVDGVPCDALEQTVNHY